MALSPCRMARNGISCSSVAIASRTKHSRAGFFRSTSARRIVSPRYAPQGGALDQALPIMDAMIAAIALAHAMTLATRNVRDFEGLGVPLVDPFTA